MRFWFEKGYFELKTPVRRGADGAFRMLGDVFGGAEPGAYLWAFLTETQVEDQRRKAKERADKPTQNPRGTWKQKHLKVPATRKNPFPNEDFESPGPRARAAPLDASRGRRQRFEFCKKSA